MERQLPKNVRQIGNVCDEPKIYVEDYVDTFLGQLQEKAMEKPVAAALTGEITKCEDKVVVYISGAIRAEDVEVEGTNLKELSSDEAKDIVEDSSNARKEANRDEDIDGVVEWGDKGKNSGYKYNNEYCTIISSDIIEFLNTLFLILSIVGVLLLVAMSAIEFIKAVTGSDEDGFKGAVKHTFIRIICIVILLLLPMLISWILNIVNDFNYQKDENNKVVIGSDGNPLCRVGK